MLALPTEIAGLLAGLSGGRTSSSSMQEPIASIIISAKSLR
jgi:hypothetical protein